MSSDIINFPKSLAECHAWTPRPKILNRRRSHKSRALLPKAAEGLLVAV
jgi:hypothetical protein